MAGIQKHTGLPWHVDTIEMRDASYGSGEDTHEGFSVYGMFDANGRCLFDSMNRDYRLIEVHEEHDEDGKTAWDELARRDFDFVRRACNSHEALVRALRAARDDLHDVLHSHGDPLDNATYADVVAALKAAEEQ
jgi:hypothetical protein